MTVHTMGITASLYVLFVVLSQALASPLVKSGIPAEDVLPMTVLDSPYEEILPTRRPWNTSFTVDTIPDNWIALPPECTDSKFLVQVNGSVLLLCTSENATQFLYDMSQEVKKQLIGLPGPIMPGCQLTTDGDNTLLFAACPTFLASIQCLSSTCTAEDVWPAQLPELLNSSLVYESPADKGVVFAVASSSVTILYEGFTNGKVAIALSLPWGTSAMEYMVDASCIALGNSSKLSFWDSVTFQLREWEWVTDVATGSGAPIDDAITALAYDSASGLLYVGNPTCLNMRYPDGTYGRVDGLGGLPYAEITALTLEPLGTGSAQRRLWIGTTAGIILLDPAAPSTAATHATVSTSLSKGGGIPAVALDTSERFRYFYGPRWVPVTQACPMGAQVLHTGCVHGAESLYCLTTTGMAQFTSQNWTLAEKAAHFEALLPTFDLYNQGMVGICTHTFMGRSPCVNENTDNMGTWTSLIVAAELFRWSASHNPEAMDALAHYLDGMELLIRVTGIPGLMARCCVPPGGNAGGGWYNSTALPGYKFESDASSDEVTSHMYAYPLLAYFDATVNATLRARAEELMLQIATYITKNNFTLVDVTGSPTSWGRWDPATLNGNRLWSDERGLNSLQMLSWLRAGMYATNPDSPTYSLFKTAYDVLTQQQWYQRNILNAKILSPCDINYSDDELTFFAYITYFMMASSDAAAVQAGLLSLQRTWANVRRQKPSAWNIVYLSLLNASSFSMESALSIFSDAVWNMRAWPLELTRWPVSNSQRLDVWANPEAPGDSWNLLPPNERLQDRWCCDPFTLDGGDGMSASDPGVFLFPYWMARALGFLQAPSPL